MPRNLAETSPRFFVAYLQGQALGHAGQVLAIGFSSDWLYPTSELRMLLAAATAVGVNAAYHEVVTDAGHDGFLLPDTGLAVRLHAFLG